MRERWCFNTEVMGSMSASVLFFLKSLRRNLFFDGIFLEDYFIQDEVLCYVV